MPKVSYLAKLRVNEGKGDELVAAFRPVFEQVEKEPGTVLYVMSRAKDDPDVFWFSEIYTDDAALAAHGSSDAMAKAAPGFNGLIADAEMLIGEPVFGEGLPG